MGGNKKPFYYFPFYAYPIYKQWDGQGIPCPKHKEGWIALLQKDYPNVSFQEMEASALAPREATPIAV